MPGGKRADVQESEEPFLILTFLHIRSSLSLNIKDGLREEVRGTRYANLGHQEDKLCSVMAHYSVHPGYHCYFTKYP